jgi:hypothetical protein
LKISLDVAIDAGRDEDDRKARRAALRLAKKEWGLTRSELG